MSCDRRHTPVSNVQSAETHSGFIRLREGGREGRAEQAAALTRPEEVMSKKLAQVTWLDVRCSFSTRKDGDPHMRTAQTPNFCENTTTPLFQTFSNNSSSVGGDTGCGWDGESKSAIRSSGHGTGIRRYRRCNNSRQRSAHSLATGPAMADPFISPLGLTTVGACQEWVSSLTSALFESQ